MDQSVVPGLYYVEGLDGVGKDTIGAALARKRNALIGKLALCDGNPWNVDKSGYVSSNHPLFPVYMLQMVIWDILHFEQKENRVQISLAGVRSAAWQLARSEPLAPLYVEVIKNYPVFNHAILLKASLAEKRKRLLERERTTGSISSIDKLVFTEPQFVESMDSILIDIMREYFGATVIDTDNLNIDEVEAIALKSFPENSGGRSTTEFLHSKISQDRLGYIQGELLKQVEDMFRRRVISDGERIEVRKTFEL